MDDKNTPLGVGRRDYKDRKPGKPVPFHEPDPNRFALSAAIHAQIEREAQAKARRSATYHKQETHRAEKAGREPPAPRTRPTMAETLANAVIPAPPRIERAAPKGTGEIRATRDGVELYFTSAAEAAAAFTSDALAAEDRYATEIRYSTILRAYMRDGGGTATVFGWKWERLANRPARTRARDKRK